MTRPLLRPTSVDPHTALDAANVHFACRYPTLFTPEATA